MSMKISGGIFMSTIDVALKILQQNNFKITKQRQYLLEYLAQQADFYIALSQLDQQMRAFFPKMSHDTIYRNVKEMQQIGILETKMFTNGLRVKFQCDFAKKEHSHFICEQCGRALELPLPDFTAIEQQLSNYQINNYHVEIWGICDQCQI
ncbi:transcriptional repressor [Bombilactobacillus bombi]|uniref:Transcriptional repressor n=2 Tax=Bombilactobacillus bombi TaxID=1303590 RepID=A0A3R6XX88_9LACO|nr:transcriptional repressor [Bombilactobacillus bombi]